MAVKLANNLTFEKALEELEEITQKLEEGKESLDNSMALYEKGSALKSFCEKKLKEAEGTWQVLKKNRSGEVTTENISSEKIPEPDELSNMQDSMF